MGYFKAILKLFLRFAIFKGIFKGIFKSRAPTDDVSRKQLLSTTILITNHHF
jgi:hypothetical protein